VLPVEHLALMLNCKHSASLLFRALISEEVKHLELVRTSVALLKRSGLWYHKCYARGPKV
jgi:hypothetical protein